MDPQDPESKDMRELFYGRFKDPKHKEKAEWGDSTIPTPTRNQPALYKLQNLQKTANLGEEEATRIQQQ